MNPINFPESNLTLLGDPAEGVSNLPVHRSPDQGIIVSCWQPDERERAMIAEGHPVWLMVASAQTQPPVKIVAGPAAVVFEPAEDETP
jgi:hypothetical protein